MSLDGERLTVRLDEAPLRLVLAELARQGGFRVYLGEGFDAPFVSARFERLPVDEALEQLLAGWSHALVYAAGPLEQGRSTPRIAELLVFSRAPSEGPRGGEAPDAPPLFADPGAQERIRSLEQWAATREGSDVDPLTHALVDSDEQVRTRAAELLERLWPPGEEASQIHERAIPSQP